MVVPDVGSLVNDPAPRLVEEPATDGLKIEVIGRIAVANSRTLCRHNDDQK